MSIICQSCCGDGLHHYDGDVFELVHDDVCPECQGAGVNEDAGNPVPLDKVKKQTNEEMDVKIYLGEGVDDFEEMPVRFMATYYKGHYGAREKGGMQLEPDEPAGYEFDYFYVQIKGEWYSVDPDEEHSSPYTTLLDRCEVIFQERMSNRGDY